MGMTLASTGALLPCSSTVSLSGYSPIILKSIGPMWLDVCPVESHWYGWECMGASQCWAVLHHLHYCPGRYGCAEQSLTPWHWESFALWTHLRHRDAEDGFKAHSSPTGAGDVKQTCQPWPWSYLSTGQRDVGTLKFNLKHGIGEAPGERGKQRALIE